MKKKLISTIIFITSSYFAIAQAEYAVDKGAVILSGNIGFSSQGGDLYESSGKRITNVSLTPSVSAFIGKNFFMGGAVEFASQSQGDVSISSTSIGPHIGYAGGSAANTTFPYFSLGARYHQEHYDLGTLYGDGSIGGLEYVMSLGAIISLKSHVGLNLGLEYHSLNLKPSGSMFSSVGGNVIALSVGVNGLLFKGAAKKPAN